ncbi:conjugative transposon protein TraK [Algoriphagus pacificus]|uniref:Conjugative transposon protein TraK n=1 Tax=Algoriphagus pacificus TaxID=2811234 RepID=A0ABS3CMR1_9BACT|nr:conjugative transposon protein TraK [Algoriphagus pacificus]MBN7817471.1 conjugative transposon protein TraK [Algoriphagus pacificus]
MFQNLQNIDTAFQHVKYLSFTVVFLSLSFSGYMGFMTFRTMEEAQNRIYILAEGKALEAFASDKRDNIQVEAKDHVKMFHHYFFTLSPDEKFIRKQIGQSLYLTDGSAKRVYDNLREQGYYSELVSSNINQTVDMDSVTVSLDTYPFRFHYYGKQHITRSSSRETRNLITTGRLRYIDRTDQNPHGFLIEQWETLANETLKIEKR